MAFRLFAIGLLAAFGSAVRADDAISLSPEAVLPGHGQTDAYRPAVAFGADGYLVAWEAGRIGPGDISDRTKIVGTADIVACRLDKTGKSADAQPFVVSGATDIQERPRAAYGAAGGGPGAFLVVWQDIRNGKDYDVYAARVSPAGKVLDGDGLCVAGGPHNQSSPRVAFDGTNFLVVWEDMRTGRYAVRAGRVSLDGKLLDGDGVVVSGTRKWQCLLPAATSAGAGRCLVVWKGHDRPGAAAPPGAAFVKDGRVESSFDLGGHHYASPFPPMALAAGPKGFLMVWRNYAPVGRATPSRNANAAFIGLDGQWSPPDQNAAKGSAFKIAGSTVDPDVAWDGHGFVAAWDEQRKERRQPPYDALWCRRASADDGKPAGPAVPVAGTYASPACGVALASDGAGTTAIVYEKHPADAETPIRIAVRMAK